jgi:hypothetical protein
MPFKRGHAKLGGRRKGSRNHATLEVREFFQSLLEDSGYQTHVRRRLRAGKAERLEVLLWQHALPRLGAGADAESESQGRLDFLDIVRQAYKLAHTPARDPRAAAEPGAVAPPASEGDAQRQTRSGAGW